MASSMKAATHLGKDFVQKSEIHKNTQFENFENVFDITRKIDSGTVWRNSECGMPEPFITIMREMNVGKWSGDQMGKGKSICPRAILFYVLVRWNKFQEQQKSGKANFQTSRCLDHIKMQWESMEKQLNSSRQISKFFSILSIRQEIQKDLIQKEPNHLRVNVQRHLVEIRWSELHLERREIEGLHEAVLSKTLDVSWSRLRDDMVRRFSRTVGTAGISHQIRWYNNSKKQDILFSWASVLWIGEFWNEDKTKVPCTSIENPRTRNSCFRRFILLISSVST